MNTINLEFSENILRILQLNELKEIIFKDEIDLGFNINNDFLIKKNQDELVIEFAERIGEVFNNANNELKTAGVLMNTSETFLNVIPIDFNEDQNSINSHILWELSNYFPETYKNFNIKYYRLNNNFLNDKIDEVLIIAVDKNKINFIKNLCNNSNIKIKNVEIDQFVVEKCLKENYPVEVKTKNILIVGCKNSRIDFSLLAQGKIRYYDYEIFDLSNFKSLIVKQINFYNSTFNDLSIEKIFLYGKETAETVKNLLKSEFKNVKISFINPIDSRDGENNYSQYAPLYGLALKNFFLER